MTGHQPKPTWQSDLIARYPHLFNFTTDGKTYAPGYPTVGDGWRDLVEVAVGRIATVVSSARAASVVIEQTKQKYGTLRLYWYGRNLDDGANYSVEEAVALAEARSACTCEVCGAPGVLHDRGGWLATACPDHARGEPVPIKSGFDNVHIVRAFEHGRYPILSCRRYDRDHDTFVDVDPKSLGIEEDF